MARASYNTRTFARSAALAAICGVTAGGCGLGSDSTSLSKTDDDGSQVAFTPPPEQGPKLGAIANATPILEKPGNSARTIGWLHAGAFVARSDNPVRKTPNCEAGYYAIFPRGVVCLNQGATLDAAHPTLQAMAIRPALDQPLPYTYGRARVETSLLERDPARADSVREVQKLPRGSAMAIVGSWSARIGDAEPERLGLLGNGRFVRASDLEAVKSSTFAGYELNDEHELPVAFVVKRGVSQFKPDDERFVKSEPLEYHQVVELTGRFRSMNGTKLWSVSPGEAAHPKSQDAEHWVRDQDVTVVQRRTRFPEFVRDGQRWLDVGVILGTLVAYEGKKPVFATLVSTGRDRLGEASNEAAGPPAITKLGNFEVVAKHVTLLGAAPERAGEHFAVFDVPWALELSSGQLIHGAYWHDRFGIEHGPGDIELSPSDARRIFEWATPALPKAWHSVSVNDTEKTMVVVHK